MLTVKNPQEVQTAPNAFAYPSRWSPMLAAFVGWREGKPIKGNLSSEWYNVRNEHKILQFHSTYAQGMFVLEKVENKFSCKSYVGTDSCFIYPNGANSDLPYPIEFKGADKKQCIYNCVVAAVNAVLSNDNK